MALAFAILLALGGSAPAQPGSECAVAADCAEGEQAPFCADGFCCASEACGSGETCATGVCKKVDGTACKDGKECASGVCAGGVCCDRACEGDCQSCVEAGQRGACVAFARGTDPRRACGAFACDGLGQCLAACGSHEDCDVSHYCDGQANGQCLVRKLEGEPCASHRECVVGFCACGGAGCVCDASRGHVASGRIAFCAWVGARGGRGAGAGSLVVLGLAMLGAWALRRRAR